MAWQDDVAALQETDTYMYIDDCVEELGLPVVKNAWISGTTRWSVINSMVIQDPESLKLYLLTWHTPATERQEEDVRRWTAERVRAVERTITEYERWEN